MGSNKEINDVNMCYVFLLNFIVMLLTCVYDSAIYKKDKAWVKVDVHLNISGEKLLTDLYSLACEICI